MTIPTSGRLRRLHLRPTARVATLCLVCLFAVSTAQAQEPSERDGGFYPASPVIDLADPVANRIDPAMPGRMLIEDFEGTAFPPAGWTRFERLGNDSQRWVVVNVDGNRLAYNRYSDLGSGVIEDWLVTPLLSVTASDNTLQFDMAQQYTTVWGSTYSVAVSTASADQPGDFSTIASWSETEGPEGQPAPLVYSTPASLTTYTLDLSDYVGQDVYIAFVHENDYGDSFILDNVDAPAAFVASAAPDCAAGFAPADGAVDISPESLSLTWDPPSGGEAAAGYLVSIGTDPGATNIANDFDVGNNTSIELASASPGVTYYYRVTPYNGAGTATGCQTISFATAGPQRAFPFTEDFDDSVLCARPAGWTLATNATSGEPWLFRPNIQYGAQQDHTSGSGCFAAVNDSAPEDTPTSLISPFLDFSTLAAPTLSFWIQNQASTRPFVFSDLFIDVSVDGGQSYTNAVGGATGRYRQWTKIVVDLAAYAGEPNVRIRFRAVEATGFSAFRSDISLDDVFIGEDPTGAVFAISPGSSGLYSFGEVTPCGGRERVFTIINDGTRRSTLNISALRIIGDAAYSVVDVNPVLPVILGEDETVAIRVQFNPTDDAIRTATLEIDYTLDAGAEQTFSIAFKGEGDVTGKNSGEGDGYVWRNSTLCSSPSIGLEAIGYGPSSGDTEVTAWTTGGPNDGFFALDLAPTIGSFRFFGEDYTQAFLSTNGYVFFDFGSVSPGPPFPANPDYENAYIAALGDDLTLGTGGSLFYRGEDLDNDGADDQLVITYFRVPRFNVPSEFATVQVILRPGSVPGSNGTVKLQYLVGADPNDGQPLTQGFGNNASFNADSRVGITGDQGYANILYRDNGFGGVLFSGNSLALEFAPRAERVVGPDVASQRSGWRMLAPPAAGMTVADLSEQNLVQGIPGEYLVDANGNPGGTNIFTRYSGDTGFQRPSGLSESLTSGKGFIWFFFDIDYDPEVDAGIFTGDSESYSLPAPIVATGVENASDVTVPLTSAPDNGGVRAELLGNPFMAPLDISAIGSWTTGNLASAIGQYWDPATRSYVPTSTLGDVLPMWQGAFFENTDATDITYPTAATQPATSEPPQRSGAAPGPRHVRFQLRGTASSNGAATMDQAAVLEFSEDGTDGWDIRDATKLSPLVNTYATLAFGGERDGVPRLKAQESRASAPASFLVPLFVETARVTGDLSMSWTLDVLLEDWSFTLIDQATGERVDMRAASTYEFQTGVPRPIGSVSVAAEKAATAPEPLERPAAQRRTSEARFLLSVETPVQATGADADPATPTFFGLSAPYPNPFSGSAMLRYDLPETAPVRLAVYDALGRRVALLVEEHVGPGYHEVRWQPEALPSGLYFVRLDAGPKRFVQKITFLD